MKRCLAVVSAVLTLGAAGVVAPATAGASTSPIWHRVFQMRGYGLVEGIAAIGRTNVWAVAHLYRDSKDVFRPDVWHFGGHAWKRVTVPGARMTSDIVQATSPSDVWVVGRIPNTPNGAASGAYRWDGRRWQKIPVPRLTYLQGIDVVSQSDVWAFGLSATTPADVFHWDGRGWKSYNLKFIPQFISASSASNVWVTGATNYSKTSKAAASRWNGRRWQTVPLPFKVFEPGPGVTALSPSNVWIGWEGPRTSRAEHWDGRRWSLIITPVSADGYDIVPDGRGGYWFGPFADWTGHAWIQASQVSPENEGASYGDIVRIPGTLSYLMGASVQNHLRSTAHPTIYRLNLP